MLGLTHTLFDELRVFVPAVIVCLSIGRFFDLISGRSRNRVPTLLLGDRFKK